MIKFDGKCLKKELQGETTRVIFKDSRFKDSVVSV
jgi:hypothetical protein